MASLLVEEPVVNELGLPLLSILVPYVPPTVSVLNLSPYFNPLKHLDASGKSNAVLDLHTEQLVLDGRAGLALAVDVDELIVVIRFHLSAVTVYHLLVSL